VVPSFPFSDGVSDGCDSVMKKRRVVQIPQREIEKFIIRQRR